MNARASVCSRHDALARKVSQNGGRNFGQGVDELAIKHEPGHQTFPSGARIQLP